MGGYTYDGQNGLAQYVRRFTLGSVAELQHEASLEVCQLAEHTVEGLLARQEGRAEVVRPLRLPKARAQEG